MEAINIVDRIAGVSNAMADMGPFFRDYVYKNPLIRWVFTLLTLVYTYVVVKPMAKFYLKGPRFFNLGMWGGMEPQDICAEITGVASSHWTKNYEDCYNIIQQRFDAVMIGAWLVFLIFVVYKTCDFMWYTYVTLPAAERKEVRLLQVKASLMLDMQRKMREEDLRLERGGKKRREFYLSDEPKVRVQLVD
jgi:hypothetical protein